MNTSGSSGYSGDFNNKAHGSACFLSPEDALKVQLFDCDPARGSIILARSGSGKPASLNRPGHVVLVAPARSGKNVGVIIPILLTYQNGSRVVIDGRAENAAVVSEYLESQGVKVIRLDPTQKLASFGLNLKTHCFDPLHASLTNPDQAQVLDDINMNADALLVDKGGERDPHWRDGARQVLAAVMTYQAFYTPPEQRTLIAFSRLVSGIDLPLEKTCQALTFNKHPDFALRDVISRMGAWYGKVNPKERASFVSMALRSTAWLNSPAWHKHVGKSDFNPMDLNTDKMAIFIICPFEKAEQYAPWVRLVLTSLIIGILRGPRRHRVPTLFLLDEYANVVGRLALLEQSISFIEGSGARYVMVFHSIPQLSAMMPDNQFHALIANAGAQVFMNVSDQVTADYVSKFMGNYSAMTPGPGGMSFVSRPLMMPDEILTMPPDDALVFIRGFRAAHLEKINVLRDQPYKSMSDAGLLKPNPVHAIQPPKPKALLAEPSQLLSIDDAIGDASTANINLQSLTAALQDKYPGRNLCLQDQLCGFYEPWTNPDTGETESVFTPIVHVSLLETLTNGGPHGDASSEHDRG